MPRSGARRHLSAMALEHGLPALSLRSLRRTFDALTGTPLTRLRRGMLGTLRDSLQHLWHFSCAERRAELGAAEDTSFRWRHRFCAWTKARLKRLTSMVKIDRVFYSGRPPKAGAGSQHAGRRQQQSLRGLDFGTTTPVLDRPRPASSRSVRCRTARSPRQDSSLT